MLWMRERLLARVIRDERGVTGVEYGLIAALIGLAVVGAVSLLGHVLGSGYAGAANAVTGSRAAVAASTPAASPTTAPAAANGATPAAPAAAAGGTQVAAAGTREGGETKVTAEEKAAADERAAQEAKAAEEAAAKAAEAGTAVCDAGFVADGGGGCADGPAYCEKQGQFYDAATNACQSSSETSCTGDQTYDPKSNTCLVPKCADSGMFYEAKSGSCVESVAKTCQAGKQGYSAQTNTCYACPVAFDGATGTCVPQKDCSADNRMPNAWNFCLTVDEYVGTMQGASLSSVGNGWLPQSPGTTRTYNVFSAKDTKSWKDEPWLLSVAPYAAEVVSVVVSDPSKGLSLSSIETPTFTKDTLTVTTPKGPAYGQYTVTYTVAVSYPWNGTTKKVTKTVSTKVGLQ